MEEIVQKKFLLAAKRDKNDYLPLEWSKTSLYAGEDMNSLEGIDQFTSKTTELDLLNEILACGLMDLEDKYMQFVIIFFENGKWREVKEGVAFADKVILDDSSFISYVQSHIDDKEFINYITTLYNKVFTSYGSQQFYFALKNMNFFKEKGEKYVRAGLELFKNMTYEEKRKLRISVSNRLLKPETTNARIYKKDNNDKI